MNGAADAPLPRLRKEDFAKAAPDRFEAEAAFYMEIEHDYFRDMAKFLRGQLGVKSLLIGNSDHGHGRSCYPLIPSLAQLDIVDGHIYCQPQGQPFPLTQAADGWALQLGEAPTTWFVLTVNRWPGIGAGLASAGLTQEPTSASFRLLPPGRVGKGSRGTGVPARTGRG